MNLVVRLLKTLGHQTNFVTVAAVIMSCSLMTGCAANNEWKFIGPFETAEEGIVWTVAAHPKESGTLIAGTRPQGALKTVDGGKSWRMSSEEFESTMNRGFNPKGVLFSYMDPNIVFAGIERLGVWKSRDGGDSWIEKNTGIASGYGRNAVSFAISPVDVDTVYVGTDGGLYKSENGGDDWRRLSKGLPTGITQIDKGIHSTVASIVVSPNNEDVIYVAFFAVGHGETAGVYKSTDGGESWSMANAGIETGSSNAPHMRKEYAFGLSIDPGNTEILYVATYSGVYKTVNAAGTWIKQYAGWCFDILVDPFDSNLVYAIETPRSVIRSIDGGNTWANFSEGLPESTASAEKSEQIELILADGSTTTITVDSSQDAMWAYRLEATPADPDHIYLAASNGVFRMQRSSGKP